MSRPEPRERAQPAAGGARPLRGDRSTQHDRARWRRRHRGRADTRRRRRCRRRARVARGRRPRAARARRPVHRPEGARHASAGGAASIRALRRSLGSDPVFDLWIYGDGRSCKLEPEDEDSISCAFLLGQAQVARAAVVDDAPAAVAAWLVEGLPLRLLVTRVRRRRARAPRRGAGDRSRAVALAAFPRLDRRPGRRSRAAAPADRGAGHQPGGDAVLHVLQPAHALLLRQLALPVVDDGLPVVWAVEPGVYLVGDNAARRIADDVARTATPCDLARAVPLIEGMLAASRFQPFFGSRPHRDLPAGLRTVSRARGARSGRDWSRRAPGTTWWWPTRQARGRARWASSTRRSRTTPVP